MFVILWMELVKENGGGDNYIIRFFVCEYICFVSYILSLFYLLFENLKFKKNCFVYKYFCEFLNSVIIKGLFKKDNNILNRDMFLN